jgi:hypothetical protein
MINPLSSDQNSNRVENKPEVTRKQEGISRDETRRIQVRLELDDDSVEPTKTDSEGNKKDENGGGHIVDSVA